MPSLSWAASLFHLPNLYACPPTRDEFGRSVDLAENFRETASGTFHLIGGEYLWLRKQTPAHPHRTFLRRGWGVAWGSWAASLGAARRVGSAPQSWPRARAHARGSERKSAKLLNEWREDPKTASWRRALRMQSTLVIEIRRHFPQCRIWPIVRVARYTLKCSHGVE